MNCTPWSFVIGEGDLLVLWVFESIFCRSCSDIYSLSTTGVVEYTGKHQKEKNSFQLKCYDCFEQMKKVDQHNRFTNMLRHDSIHPQLLPIHLGFVRHPNCFFPFIFLVLSIMFMFDFIRGEDCGSVH